MKSTEDLKPRVIVSMLSNGAKNRKCFNNMSLKSSRSIFLHFELTDNLNTAVVGSNFTLDWTKNTGIFLYFKFIFSCCQILFVFNERFSVNLKSKKAKGTMIKREHRNEAKDIYSWSIKRSLLTSYTFCQYVLIWLHMSIK